MLTYGRPEVELDTEMLHGPLTYSIHIVATNKQARLSVPF